MTGADRRLRTTIESYFGVGAEEVESVLGSLRPVHLDGGDWLFRQGDDGESILFLIRGRLQVWVDGERPGEATLLGEIVPGDSVGEVSMLTGAPRSAGVRAIRDSELVAVDRDAFRDLADRHPVLAMRLAGRVARVLRDRTSGAATKARRYRTVAVVRLGSGAAVDRFCAAFEAALDGGAGALAVDPADLARCGAPWPSLEAGAEVPAELRRWLHEREDEYGFVLYRCEADASPWSAYALRQCDLVMYVAEASSDPSLRDGERRLADAAGACHARRMLVLLHGAGRAIEGTAAWLEPREPDFHFHVREDRPEEAARVARVVSGRAVGLVLAAGAARGVAHLGVYKAMWEAGIRPDWVGGTSIGAIMGALIARGAEPDELIAEGRRAFSGANPFGDYTLPIIALLRGRRFERLLREYMTGCIEDLAVPFFAVSCNVDDGSLNLHERGVLREALRATAAMAGVMPPAVVGSHLAIDGAVLNNMPVDLMQAKPVGRIIAVDLSSQRSHPVDYPQVPSPWAVLGGRLLPFARRYRVPTLMTLMLKATELGTLAKIRELGSRADLLLRPPVREFGLMDLGAYDRIVEAGYRYAGPELAAWAATRDDGPER